MNVSIRPCLEYANDQTRLSLESSRESTLAMVKPDGLASAGEILAMAEREGFVLSRAIITRSARGWSIICYSSIPTWPHITLISLFLG